MAIIELPCSSALVEMPCHKGSVNLLGWACRLGGSAALLVCVSLCRTCPGVASCGTGSEYSHTPQDTVCSFDPYSFRLTPREHSFRLSHREHSFRLSHRRDIFRLTPGEHRFRMSGFECCDPLPGERSRTGVTPVVYNTRMLHLC